MANNDNGRIWFTAGIDNSKLRQGITAINKDFSGLQSNANQTGSVMGEMWRTAAAGVGAYLTATQALQLGQQIVQLTSQRQLLEQSFEVMLGGVDIAREKIEEINQYAIFSPYAFDGVAKGAQTLSAFGVSVDELMPTIQMIGDVAAGNAQRFESLSLVFGQVSSAGRLMGQDLLQFINAGFNPLQTISERTGQSMLELKKQMEEGAISADMVTEAFKIATSEGGKFYGMTAKMAEGIEAAASTFESAWVEKQIEWGKRNEDNIKSMYEFGTSVVENADEIAKAFGVLIAAVGTYKAALIAASVAQRLVTAAGNIQAFFSLAKGIKSAKDAMLLLNLATKASPIGLLLGVISAVASAWLLFRDNTDEAKASLERFNEEQDATIAQSNSLIAVIQSESATMRQKVEAYRELTKQSQALTRAYSLEKIMSGEVTQAQVDAILNRERDAAEYEMLTDNVEAARKAVARYQELMVSSSTAQSPDSVAYYARQLERSREELEASEKALNEYNSARSEANRLESEMSRKSGIQELIKTLSDERTAVEARTEAYEKLKVLSPELTEMYGAEAIALMTLAQAQEAAANAEDLAALRQQQTAARGALAALPAGTEFFTDPMADLRANLEEEVAALEKSITEVMGRELTVTPTTVSTPGAGESAAEKAAKAEEERMKAHLNRLKEIAEYQSAIDAEFVESQADALIARQKAEREALAAQLEEFATYAQKRAALAAELEAKLAVFYQEDGVTLKTGVDIGNVENVKSAYAELFAALDVEAAQSTELLTRMFEDAANKSSESISKIIDEGNRLVEALTKGEYDSAFGLTLDQFEALINKIPELRERLDELRGTAEEARAGLSGFADAFYELIDGIKSGDTTQFTNGLTALSSKVSEVSELLGGLSDAFRGIAEVSGNENWEKAANGIDQVSEVLGNTMDVAAAGASVGGPIGAAVGAVIGLGSSLFGLAGEAEARYRAALEAIEDAEEAYTAQSLALARERALSGEEYSSILGIDAYGQASNAVRVYAQETENLRKSLSGLASVSIITGFEKTGLFGWGKGKDVYSNVLEVFPELIDAQGQFDEQVAQTILDTREMGDESRAALEEMIATAEQAAAAYEQMGEYLTGVFGGIGASITEEIAEGLRDGKIEVDSVLASIGSSLEQFIEDMAYSIFLGDIMQQASDQLLAVQGDQSLSDTQRLEYMTTIMGNVMKSATDAVGPMEEFFKLAQEQAEQAGISIFKPEDETQGQASAGAITTVNQETAASIDGKLNALLLTGSQTATNTAITATGVINLRDTMDLVRSDVKGIHSQVKLIQTNTAVLPAMAKDMAEVKKHTAKL